MPNYIPSTPAAWLLIALSGAFEVLFSILMKKSDGFTRPLPSLISVVAAMVSVWLMTISLRTLPLGPAYAVWAGIGTLGTAVFAMLFFAEPLTILKATFMLLIVVGIVGLQLEGSG